MIIFYGVFIGLVLLAMLISKGHNEKLWKKLNKKENPLIKLYPLASKIFDIKKSICGNKENTYRNTLIKSLYVKENIEAEKYVYSVKKTALLILILSAVAVLGFLSCLGTEGAAYVKELARNEPGDGAASYTLTADYKGTEENIDINIDAVKYTEEEIYELFEDSYNEVVRIMLAGNEDQENVTEALDLISSYNGFKIYWEIEDTKILDYNGEIKADISDDEELLLNLYVTFELEDFSEKRTVPIVIKAGQLSEREKLIRAIEESIEKSDAYSETVELPDQIDGENITYRTTAEDNSVIFLILGIIAAAAVMMSYDRRLEEENKKRKEEMMLDFSEIVSKLSLLYDAGLSIQGAWRRIVEDHEKKNSGKERYAYREMKLALEKIKSGISEGSAYEEFGKRCALHSYIKLGNLLEQNLSKGTKGMKLLLKQEAMDSFEVRKRWARKKGEEASTKMLIPMIMMLLVVIVIVAVPALMSINF